MDRKTALKLRKYNLILWYIIGGCALAAILLTILVRLGAIGLEVNSVAGILIPLLVFLGALCQIAAYYKENTLAYEKAQPEQLEEITALYETVKEDLIKQGIDQWDEAYPARGDIIEDIRNKEMYIVRLGNTLAAAYTINRTQDNAYKFGSFKDKKGEYLVLHRLCVLPALQHMGLAGRVMEHIEAEAKKAGASSVRLDVFTKNPRAMALYERMGYAYAGDAYWRKGKFHLLEKLL